MRISILIPLAVAAALPLGAGAAEKSTYKWVDENGVIHYGDRIPPKYAKQQREVLNQRGDTVKVLDHEKTPEERAEDARKEEIARQEQEQAKKDAFLLSTYDDEADLLKARDEQIASLDGNLRIAQIGLQGTEKDLVTRQQRRAQLTKDGKPVPPELEKQIKTLEARATRDREALARRELERQATAARWERDIQRWRQVKSSSRGADGAAAASASNQSTDAGVGK